MKVKNESEVAQSCPTLSDPMNCSLPGSSVHGIFQAINAIQLPKLVETEKMDKIRVGVFWEVKGEQGGHVNSLVSLALDVFDFSIMQRNIQII